MAEENTKTTKPVETAAVAQANRNGEAATNKFSRAKNFSSDNFTGGRRNDRGRGNRRDGRGRGRRDNKPVDKTFEDQTISIDRVSRTVAGGRRLRFKALVVVGDRKNRVGVGVAKGNDVQSAIEKATTKAKKYLITFPMNTKGATIPHEVEIKHGGAHVLLKPAAPGTGLIAGGVVRSILGVTGITNIISKSLGSANKVNIAYATIDALRTLQPRDHWVTTKEAAAPATKGTKGDK
ncbi:MAG: 30S ribosomal protein S5 [Candidatus Nanoperiomorbaceae bacterium]